MRRSSVGRAFGPGGGTIQPAGRVEEGGGALERESAWVVGSKTIVCGTPCSSSFSLRRRSAPLLSSQLPDS